MNREGRLYSIVTRLLVFVVLLMLVGCNANSETDVDPQPSATPESAEMQELRAEEDRLRAELEELELREETERLRVELERRKATPTLIPTATPVPPTPTPVPPTSTPVPPTAPVKLEALAQAEIPRIAWQDSQRVMVFNSQSFSPQVDLKIRVGPTTTPYFGDVEPMYRKAITFWARFDQPTIFLVLIYNSQDRPWAREQIQNASFIPQEGRDVGIVDAPCNGDICSGANAGIRTNSSVGLGVLGIHQPDSWDQYRYGPLQIHEYTHAVQPAPWIGDFQPLAGAQNSAPCWLNEGLPHFAGLSVGTNSYEAYLKLRAQQVWGDLFSRRPRVPSFTDFSPTAIVDYYDKSLPGQCYPPRDPHGHYDLGYSLGFLTVEALSAVGGADSTMNLYKLMQSNSFETAFELTYGTPWDEAKHIIASVVSSNIFDIENNISKFR